MTIQQVKLESIPCWVQIWNLPLGYVDVDFVRAIGAHIGEVLEVDKRSIEQERGRYIRVKVRLDVNRPLKRGGLVPMQTQKVQVAYRYEKLCDVCLYCGMMGHEHHNCKDKFVDESRRIIRDNKFDSWMGSVHNGVRKVQGRRRDYWKRDEKKDKRDKFQNGGMSNWEAKRNESRGRGVIGGLVEDLEESLLAGGINSSEVVPVKHNVVGPSNTKATSSVTQKSKYVKANSGGILGECSDFDKSRKTTEEIEVVAKHGYEKMVRPGEKENYQVLVAVSVDASQVTPLQVKLGSNLENEAISENLEHLTLPLKVQELNFSTGCLQEVPVKEGSLCSRKNMVAGRTGRKNSSNTSRRGPNFPSKRRLSKVWSD
ncbi:hypothetical protein LIER_01374 [Lithospermum erythrorhizon]|uniref:Zinc knuckle CX2CX4HX4C domain-containing protein n=1 Tax=Lithospermum erythrorhizon TaxID=34254 RepID=A0AAV3NLF0_LITER